MYTEWELEEGKKQLGGVRVLLWIMVLIFTLFLFLTIGDLSNAEGNIGPNIGILLIFIICIAIFLIPLIGIIKRKPFTTYIRILLIIIMIVGFPIGTIVGAILWSRVNHPSAKKYLNYSRISGYRPGTVLVGQGGKEFIKKRAVIFGIIGVVILITVITVLIKFPIGSQEGNIKRLISNLDDGREEVQTDLINQLSDIGKPAIPYLHEAIKGDNLLIKKNTIVILGNIKDPSSIEPLIEQFSEENEEVNSAAVMSISFFGNSAVEPLFNVLSSDNELIRKNALDAINKIGVEDISLKEILFIIILCLERNGYKND